MKQKFSTIVLLVLFFSVLVYTQEKSFQSPAPFKIDAAQIENSTTYSYTNTSSYLNLRLANWVAVDTMNRSLMAALATLNPLAYDADADVVAFVHEPYSGYSSSNGNLWYNISTDAGASWERVSSFVNEYTYKAHYPSFAISNRSGGNITETVGVSTWSIPTSTNQPRTGYSYMSPLIGGTIFSDTLDESYITAVCWTGSVWSFWTGSYFDIYRTADFVNIEKIVSPNLTGFASICLGGVSDENTSYLGLVGTIDHPDTNNPIITGWYPGYSKSTDNGLTWSEVIPADFRTIPTLNQYDRLFDYIKGDMFVSYNAGDINVDANGYVHLVFSVTDTTTSSNTGLNSLIEVYETASGLDGKVIYEGISETIFTAKEGVAWGQMGPNGYLAFDKDREMMACVWVADNPSTTQGLCDVYISFRSLNSEWSTPVNLTQTENMNENGAHLAPVLRKNSDNSYTAFAGYFYQLGYFGPDPSPTLPTGFWVTPYTFTPTDIKEPVTGITDFKLEQNYPNPFNPVTKISWQSPFSSWQSLKVYDILGNEVATLVNEEKPAGEYEIEFNASNLASGVYYYQLKSGNFIETKKMIMLK